MPQTKTRQSNIELLRILSMCGVIMLHYNNATIGGALSSATGVNLYILYALECLSVCAVDLFVLISGYFLIRSQTRSMIKPISLLLQLFLFNAAFFVLNLIKGETAFSALSFLTSLLKPHWFITLYIALYFISPFINTAINETHNKGLLKKAVIILYVCLSIYPGIMDLLQEIIGKEINGLSTIGMYGSQRGYSIINFILMYIIGASIRLENKKQSRKTSTGMICLCTSILFIWTLINQRIGFLEAGRSAWSYCNPIVILLSVEIFLLFNSLNIGSRKVINILSKASFTVLLTHIKFLPFIKIPQYTSGSTFIMLVHILISIAGIYLCGWIIWFIYDNTIEKILKSITAHIPVINQDIWV